MAWRYTRHFRCASSGGTPPEFSQIQRNLKSYVLNINSYFLAKMHPLESIKDAKFARVAAHSGRENPSCHMEQRQLMVQQSISYIPFILQTILI